MIPANKLTYDFVKEKIEQQGYVLLDKRYINAHAHLTLKCNLGYLYSITFTNFSRGKKPTAFSNKNPYIKQNINLLLKNNGTTLEIISDYINPKTKIHLKNSEGFMFTILLDALQKGVVPSMVHPENPYSINNIKLWCVLKDKAFDLISDKYFRNNIKLNWLCKKCNKQFEMSWACIQNGIGCNLCDKSHGEDKIELFLMKQNIEYYLHKTFDGCRRILPLSFDFYLIKHNTCIEFQGRQHYLPVEHFGGKEYFKIQQTNDNIKRQYCSDNNIKLIEIPYWEFNNIEKILNKELLTIYL